MAKAIVNASEDATTEEIATEEKPKTCFVIMPISDIDGYEPGHFTRVYEHIIKPACHLAGFQPIRADETDLANHIIIDILRQILNADMTICDLSGRNPNVLYELGIRQAFNKSVTLIKDEKTSGVFDIQSIRYVQYDSSLRIDKLEQVVPKIESALRNTYADKAENINSIVSLLGIEPAKTTKTEISSDTNLLLDAINGLSKRLHRIEDGSVPRSMEISSVIRSGIPGKIAFSIILDSRDDSNQIINEVQSLIDSVLAQIKGTYEITFMPIPNHIVFEINRSTGIAAPFISMVQQELINKYGPKMVLFSAPRASY